jgi:nitrate reductase NapA
MLSKKRNPTENKETMMAQTRREFIRKAAALSAASYVSMNLPIGSINLVRADEGVTWHRGSCRLCGVGCRVELGVKNGVPMGLRGVTESRTNLGYLCMKGMHFWKYAPSRSPDQTLYREKDRQVPEPGINRYRGTRFAEP